VCVMFLYLIFASVVRLCVCMCSCESRSKVEMMKNPNAILVEDVTVFILKNNGHFTEF
jgi:hypothetical protein